MKNCYVITCVLMISAVSCVTPAQPSDTSAGQKVALAYGTPRRRTYRFGLGQSSCIQYRSGLCYRRINRIECHIPGSVGRKLSYILMRSRQHDGRPRLGEPVSRRQPLEKRRYLLHILPMRPLRNNHAGRPGLRCIIRSTATSNWNNVPQDVFIGGRWRDKNVRDFIHV